MTLAQESFSPPRGDAKRSYVREMFTAIAPRYDLLNHVLSLNIDRRWRRQAVKLLGVDENGRRLYLDLCAGTLDLAAEIASQRGFAGKVIGADFVVPMLRGGAGKSTEIAPVGADALQLPFSDQQFDGCTIGFGVRNLANLEHGLAEVARVLNPGARLVVLEFSTPQRWPIRTLYLLYFRHVLPLIGRLISKHNNAYTYLPSSVLDFPEPPAFEKLMERAGFSAIRSKSLTFGIANLFVGVRV